MRSWRQLTGSLKHFDEGSATRIPSSGGIRHAIQPTAAQHPMGWDCQRESKQCHPHIPACSPFHLAPHYHEVSALSRARRRALPGSLAGSPAAVHPQISCDAQCCPAADDFEHRNNTIHSAIRTAPCQRTWYAMSSRASNVFGHTMVPLALHTLMPPLQLSRSSSPPAR